MVKRFIKALLITAFVVLPLAADNKYDVIPAPAKLSAAKGVFTFDQNTKLYFSDPDIESAFVLFRKQLKDVAGFDLEKGDNKGSNIIICKQNKLLEKSESYKLHISPSKIEIEAHEPIGFYYAVQTLRQLLPAEVESKTLRPGVKWAVPCCKIEDSPTFLYRGLHLDVCRNFASIDEVKSYIDQISFLKLNTFHWHLTDDQGWRIEIKKYPKLTQIGGFRDRTMRGHNNDYPRVWDNTRSGGYYTQDEIKEVVAYAKERFVTIIPEIEMPGHATAAIASYPEYSCTGGPFDVEGRWGVFNDVFCAKDETFNFLEDILTEVAELFPGEYIHIGGDECPKVRWEHCHACQERMKAENLKNEHELQSYFVKRIEKFLNSKGRRIIGWDEILDGGIAPDATVMSWRGVAGGISAAKQGHDVIMTPSEAMYLDFYQSQLAAEPLAIGGYLPIEKVYAFNATPSELTAEQSKHIIGLQANVWTEYMPTRNQREYMIFPRVAALAEVAWLPESKKNFSRFSASLPSLLERYKYMGLNYSNAFYSIVGTTVPNKEGGLDLILKTNDPSVEIRYTTDNSQPTTVNSPIYKTPISISQKEITVKAIPVKNGEILYLPYEQYFIVNKAAGQKIVFEDVAGNRFEQTGGSNLTDCIMGRYPLGRFDWFSYAGAGGTITVSFDQPTLISKMTLSAANQNNVFVYAPKEIEYLVSEDGTNFNSVGKISHDQIVKNGGKGTLSIDPQKVSKVKFVVNLYDKVPEDKAGTGTPTALFMDEIIVE